MTSAFAITTDEVLVTRARAGDLEALEAVYRAYEAPVYNLARRLCRSPQDAEDVLQETFVEVMRSVHRFRGEGSFAGWIRRVAASKALMRLRREKYREADAYVEEAEEPGGTAPRAAATAPAQDEVPARVDLESALARLSETARAVVWLHDVEGYTHEEIAEMTGMTPSFSKSQLARAHARLRRHLEGAPEARPCT
jgi:RNA polymerase sigma-70 factor (ECF subfamily)